MPIGFSKYVNIILFIFLLSACVSRSAYVPDVKFADRTTFAFTGKGVAAGMMMDAYLGGAGVAIGIAIDEGIAKDIAKNISSKSGGFDMLELVQKELMLNSKSLKSTKRKQISATKIIIETYGFHTAVGEGDKVSAWLKVRFNNNNHELVLTYPNDFTSIETIELIDAKKNPELAFNTLKNATNAVLEKWLSTLQ